MESKSDTDAEDMMMVDEPNHEPNKDHDQPSSTSRERVTSESMVQDVEVVDSTPPSSPRPNSTAPPSTPPPLGTSSTSPAPSPAPSSAPTPPSSSRRGGRKRTASTRVKENLIALQSRPPPTPPRNVKPPKISGTLNPTRINNPSVDVSDISSTILSLTAATCLTQRVVTVRVICSGEYIKRESSGQAKVKRARCYDLKWEGLPQLPPPKPPKKKAKKNLQIPPRSPSPTPSENSTGSLEGEFLNPNSSTILTEDSIKTLSSYSIHPWESLNLNIVKREGMVGSSAIKKMVKSGIEVCDCTGVARKVAGVEGGRGRWTGGEVESRSFVSMVRSLRGRYPEVGEGSFLRFLPEEREEITEGGEEETPVKEEEEEEEGEEESPASVMSNRSDEKAAEPLNLIGIMERASPAATKAAEVASGQRDGQKDGTDEGMLSMETLQAKPVAVAPVAVAPTAVAPDQAPNPTPATFPPPVMPPPEFLPIPSAPVQTPTPMQQYQIQLQHQLQTQAALQIQHHQIPPKTTYKPKSINKPPPRKKLPPSSPPPSSTLLSVPLSQRPGLISVYKNLLSTCYEKDTREHRRREWQFMTGDKVGTRLREVVNRGMELREEEKRVMDVIGKG
ncbi:hypothetical protein TrST_g983 [Triparma strigata]|uniref:Uncharacterized protein n=1 Tax=Triparma strigata TaxID=1606541 RepID=A0A9W7F1N6_9STRA|nr:hypothetical protein TrST_g983 [Triparma strigata]